jgi:hypothetical protein
VAQLACGHKALDVLHVYKQTAAVQAQNLAHHSHILLLELAHALPGHRELHKRKNNIWISHRLSSHIHPKTGTAHVKCTQMTLFAY